MTEKPLAFMSLVKLLEERIGRLTGYALLDPFPCKTVEADGSPGIVSIQKAGAIISRHIGLSDHIFVISMASQKPNVAAHIELDHKGKDVFVELSPDICRYKDAVLATLCHELSHKFLHLHDIKAGTTPIEQEFLTDVTAVYLGMGKIMLNGCDCRSIRQWTKGRQTTTETHELTTGYISRGCFAFVYRLVCGMRGIGRESFLTGLSAEARRAVEEIEFEYGDWFDEGYRGPDGAAALGSVLNEMLDACQNEAAESHRTLRRAEMSIELAKIRLNRSHEPLLEAQKKIARLEEPNDNPHLTFLRCLESKGLVEQFVQTSRQQARNVLLQWDQIKAIAALVNPLAGDDPKEIVECPVDGVKLRVPAGRKRLRVTCPTCRYKFLANTASANTEHEKPSVRGSKFTRKLFGVLRSKSTVP